MNCGIYSLVNTTNGKRYIGRTIDLNKRKTNHLWRLRVNRHPNCHLQRAWNNGERFDFEVLEYCDKNQLNDREIYWIAYYDSMRKGYNQCAGGASVLGRTCSDETKRKISEKNSGRKCSPDVIRKRTESLIKHMEEDPEFAERYRARCRSVAKGGWNKGRAHTPEEKRNLSEKLKGRYVSPEHKQKLRELYSGEKSLSAKLKKLDVVKIRYRFLCGERQIDILKDYPQITPQTIYDIVRNRRWRSVPMDIDSLKTLIESEAM